MRTTMVRYPEKIVLVAEEMLAGKVEMIDGVQQLIGLRYLWPSGSENEAILAFLVAVDSELDGVPLQKSRELWHASYLAAVDDRCAQYLATIRPQLLDYCRAIVAGVRDR